MSRLRQAWLAAALLGCALWARAENGPCEPTEALEVYCIKPSATNPEIRRFDRPHYVTFTRADAGRALPLLVFIPGTGGAPPGPIHLLRTAASNGYRVIALEYNDEPSIAVYCPEKGGPPCSARLRHMRIYGNTRMDPDIDNTRAEAIVERLYALLRHLDRNHPDQGWSSYYDREGMVWDRIALSGQSQGAGMAAFIGKQKLVRRIILFSSPWDFYRTRDNERELAPWLAWESTTPPSRWFAAYNAHENTADLLARAYRELRIPGDHVRVFRLPLPEGYRGNSPNPFHTQGIANVQYRPDWEFFLTAPTD